jgi:hypothetical protein
MCATATRTRKPARETHGTCRLIPACNLPLPAALDAGEAMLSIIPERGEPTNYLVQRLSDPDGETVGFRLTRLAAFIVDRKVYDIDVTPGYGWQCDCPDAQFQNRECKHCKSLRACLTRHSILVPAPKRQQAAPKPEAKPLPPVGLSGVTQPVLAPVSLMPADEPKHFCPECRRWNDSPFCDNCPI